MGSQTWEGLLMYAAVARRRRMVIAHFDMCFRRQASEEVASTR